MQDSVISFLVAFLEIRHYLNPPLLTKGRPWRGNGCAVTGRAEHTGGSGTAERGLGNPLERSCDANIDTCIRSSDRSQKESFFAIIWTKRCMGVFIGFNSLVVSIFLTNPLPLAWKGTPAVFFSCWAVSVARIEKKRIYNWIKIMHNCRLLYLNWTLQARRKPNHLSETVKLWTNI